MSREASSRPQLLMIYSQGLTSNNCENINKISKNFDITVVIPDVNPQEALKADQVNKTDSHKKIRIVSLSIFGIINKRSFYLFRGLTKIIQATYFEVILIHADPLSLIRWQAWALKRLISPQSLFGDFTPPTHPRLVLKRKIASMFIRWASKTTDFVITESQAYKEVFVKSGLWEKRIFVGLNPCNFIYKRVESEKKSILWIDSSLSSFSPSTKQLCIALPFLKERGWEIRYLGYQSDISEKEIESNIVYFPKKIYFLAPYFATFLFTLEIFFDRFAKGKNPASMTHSSHGNYFFSDISSVHFWGPAYFKKLFKIKIIMPKKLLHFFSAFSGAIQDYIHLHINRNCHYLFVSREIKDIALKNVAATFKVFPNSYDKDRFGIEVKLKWRESVRQELNFNDTNLVFLFSSQGHYERKGFWRAFKALMELRLRHPYIRFLVVGGYEKRIQKLKKELSQKDPNYNKWICFSGMQSQIEKYYSAADAFLFPSYFEAFCLAEIECAALGIPLLLTQHPGVEMILRHGRNGLLLPEDPKEMSKVIEKDFIQRSEPWIYDTGEAVTQEQYSQNLNALYEEVWNNKFNTLK